MTNEIGFLILVNNETKQEYQYAVSKDYLIGNSVECNLKIADEDIFEHHCRIRLVDNEVCLFSLNSQNPVYLNDELVSEEGKTLKDKDKIRINDNHEFEWKTSTDRRICSRSLPLENEPLLEKNARFSDTVLTSWKNVDQFTKERADIASQNLLGQEKDELVTIEENPELLKTELVEKSNVSISSEINRSSVECGNKIKRSANTPVKSRKSKNPVSPFSVSNTFVPDSKNDASKISHRTDNDETEFDCSTKNIPEHMFEDLIMHHSTSQKPFHSTPKAASGLKTRKNVRSASSSLVDMNFENSIEIDSSKLKAHGDTEEENGALIEKSLRKISNNDETKKVNTVSKKSITTPVKRASESSGESRRNTRGRTSLLRKTFEENSCDNEVKSLTTPEKLTEINNITQTLFSVDSEMENVTDTNADYKSLNESAKAGLASVSDENDTCEGSFIDKYKICNIVKNGSVSNPAVVAKCARNLSYISPPENNRSQEYMDSMVATPQKNSPSVRESITENFNVSATSFLSNAKDSSFDESMNMSFSSARKRRSTGFTPFVGTPSNEYRVTRKMSTPFSKSLLSRTSVDFENNMGSSRDGKHSSERRSTPYKCPPAKSSIRDSISCQPTIQESASFEELEASNLEHDSINDPKFQFITKRRGGRRYGENTFAAVDKILEESELKSDASELDNDCSFEEENTETSNSNTSVLSEGCDELSNDDNTITETAKNALELKSILTPLHKSLALKEKSAKRVTFVLPASPECTINKEESVLSVDETFTMISASKTAASSEQSFNSDTAITDEELHALDRQEADLSSNSISEPDYDSSVEGKCDESSLNVTGVQYLTDIQSNLSGIEQIQFPESNDVAETVEITDMLNETSKHSSINFTGMESSLGFSEHSNQSDVDEKSRSESRNEVGSLKEIAQTAVNESLINSPAKISCSPGIHLSGVKSLFNTPEKSRQSSNDKGVKCILNFSAKSNNETKIKSASARKSAENTKKTTLVKPTRMCKSLNPNEILATKSKILPAEQIQIVQSNVTIEVPDNEIVDLDDPNDELISTEQVIEIDSTDEESVANNEIPDIIVTEATFVDENANNEDVQLVNERNEEVFVENSTVESSINVQLEDDRFETSDLEEESNVERDDTISSDSVISDDAGSPVLTQIRRSAAVKMLSASKISSVDDKILPEENKSCTTINFIENELEKEPESSTPCNTSSLDVSCAILPACESDEKADNESQSSLDVMISDRDNSQLSDVLAGYMGDATGYMGDADASKTTINESSNYNSQLSDTSVKDISDFDSLKTNVSESGCNDSQLSDSFVKDSNDLDSLKNNLAEDNLDHSKLRDLLFAEGVNRVDLLEKSVERKNKIVECLSAEIVLQNNISENIPMPEDIEEIDDTNLINVSQSTSSSQEMAIRIDASCALINDLHKRLENTPHPSNPSSGEGTPIVTFKPVSFPESSNVSSIDASQTQPEIFNKPSIPIVQTSEDILTPIKTCLRGSSTPQSAVRRCRKSSRIHRCNPQDTSKLCNSLHECSIVLDDSKTELDAVSAKEPKDLYTQVVDELNTKLVSVKEKIEAALELPTKENSPEKVNESIPCPESAPSTDLISPEIPSDQSSNNDNVISTNSNESRITNDEPLDNLSENDTVENMAADPQESSNEREVTVNISKVPANNEDSDQSKHASTPLVTNDEVNLEQSAVSSVETVPDIKRSLRTRKEQSITPVVDSPKREVVTRNRQRGRPIKPKMKLVEEEMNEGHDDKENVCSLLKAMDVPKKIELPGEQISATIPSTTAEKKTKKPRRLKNVENITKEIEDISKRSCSIVLPLLDPEIIKSPVKVDKSGNISMVEEPQIASKRKRVAKTAKSKEPKPDTAPAASRTRQKQVKTVTFDVAQRKSDEVTQQAEETPLLSKATSTKRNLRNQTSTIEPEVTTRSRKVAVNDDTIKPKRTIKIQLEPLDDDIVGVNEPVEKKTRAKRGTTALKNAEETNEKIKTQKATKRAPENAEENMVELPKKRRVKISATDKVSSEGNTKSENVDDIVTESPKKTRGRAKTNVQVETAPAVKNVGRSTRATKNKPLDNIESGSSTGTKRSRDVDESAAGKNDAEKLNKKTKITKDIDVSKINKPVKKTTVKKPAKIINSAEESSSEEPVASTSKKISTPRMTRSRKTEVVKDKKNTPIKNTAKGTRVTRKKNVTTVESSTDDEDNSVDSKRVVNIAKQSSSVEKATTKRTVVARSRKLTTKKGRTSLTLKTSGQGSLVVRKTLTKPSTAKALPEDNLPAARSTRSRAK